ncbi:hypothetical protein BOTBODRAFT_54658 [Botryobasidium botryosum FD-172 SS1]|uniref:RNA polymerase I-specific transcription initiation factor RRN3 n=1 Tax=Botryobasidium botryosum (strain FD-172 SS1) TaxID=930990 RepID=A0A067MU55_BOTB1|nr:hypothetical protein BOTBODRAFT_54658 [Botryobasidium botryosum FD-172 SS1]
MLSSAPSQYTAQIPENSEHFLPRRSSLGPQNTNATDDKYRKDIYLAFVKDALHQRTKGNSEPYNELVRQFNPTIFLQDGASSASQLRPWIISLSHVISQLGNTHASLVEAVVALPWATMDAAFVKSYIAFVGMLVSARPEYLGPVLGRTIEGLTFQSGLRALNTGIAETSSSPLTRGVVYDRLHSLLQHLLSLIPTLSHTLQPIIVRNFPHKRQEKVAQVTYIRNLLRISNYCPELSDRILAIAIDRAIQIDVEIQVELEEIETNEDAPDADEIFEFDPFDAVVGNEAHESEEDEEEEVDLDDLSSDEESVDGGSQPPHENVLASSKHIRDMVAKLDAILKLIFEHFNHTHSIAISRPMTPSRHDPPRDASPSSRPHSPISPEQGRAMRRSQFLALLAIFDRTIIRTFKSRYTQFLLFWYSSLDPEFTDLFQGLLVSKALFEADQPAVTRVAAASYVASYVSRAQFVDRDSARRVVGLLCEYLASQLDLYADPYANDFASASQPTVFFAVSQAIFLIFCFRWRDLVEEDEVDVEDSVFGGMSSSGKKKWIPELDVIQRVITSPLNPLKVCSPNVVRQFARVAQSTDFIYCYSILETNRRTEYGMPPSTPLHTNYQRPFTSSHAVMARDHTVVADLNTFFPFDPYRLPLSYRYIEGVYREWASVALDEDADDESEEGDEDEEEEAPYGSPMVLGSVEQPCEADDLGRSFGGMSISPLRPAALAMMG